MDTLYEGLALAVCARRKEAIDHRASSGIEDDWIGDMLLPTDERNFAIERQPATSLISRLFRGDQRFTARMVNSAVGANT